MLVSRDIYDQGARHLLLPDRICDGNLPGSQRTVERFYDTSCFAFAERKTGNSAMLPLRGDNVAMVDLAFTSSSRSEKTGARSSGPTCSMR